MRRPFVSVLVSLLTLSPACGGDAKPGSEPATESGDGSSGSEAGGGELPATCECGSGDTVYSPTLECGGEKLCETITWSCPRPASDLYGCAGEHVYDEDALTCALEALRDRRAGWIEARGANEECGFVEGCGTDRHHVYIFEDAVALQDYCWTEDPTPAHSCGWNSSVARYELASPEHFQNCLGLAPGAARFGCLLSGLNHPVAVCD